jgi:hypothetical protein
MLQAAQMIEAFRTVSNVGSGDRAHFEPGIVARFPWNGKRLNAHDNHSRVALFVRIAMNYVVGRRNWY